MTSIIKGAQYRPGALFERIRTIIHANLPGFKPYMALFGCSDEINSATDSERVEVFGKHSGVFTTRTIGSQVFFHQIRVAISTGHHSNVFEVNVHIGEYQDENGQKAFGRLIGRDGHERTCCGALAHVLEDLHLHPDETPSISQWIDGEVYLDFLSTLKFRIKPHQDEILRSPNQMIAITHMNLDAQLEELKRQLQKCVATEPSALPIVLFGTISYNRTKKPDLLSLERFLLITGNRSEDVTSLL
jgi:hypothetical protein